AGALIVIGIGGAGEGIGAVGAIGRIEPHIGGEVFMGVAHAGVNDGYDDVVGGVLDIPTIRRVDVGASHAAIKAGVVQPPKGPVHIAQIIGRQQGVYEVVRFGVFDQAALPVNGDEIE